MKLKIVLPWICALGLGVGLAAVQYSNRQQYAEILLLRKDSEELKSLRADNEEASSSKARTENEELARLRKDHEDLLRLRNEVRQLRDEKTQLSKQVQTAQAQAQVAQNRSVPVPAALPIGAPTGGQQTAAISNSEVPGGAEAFAKRYGLPPPTPPTPQTPEQQKVSTCINNLRQIEGAKQQWAVEKSRPNGGLVGSTDIAPYLQGNAVPTCPGGGVYTINPVGISPICNIPGHTMSK
jgi:hypothetical protein